MNRLKNIEWVPAALAALAFVVFVAAFLYELFSYQRLAIVWARGDIDSRAHLAASNLVEPLRTQDFAAVQRIGDACESDGVHLKVTTDRGGVVFSSRSSSSRDEPFYSDCCQSGEYRVSIGMPQERMQTPFRRALRGFLLAGFVGMAGVLLFFLVTYRQRVRIRELKRIEAFRREFIADVSHEIKTPLTGILGAVDMLDDSEVKAEGEGAWELQKKLVGLIKKESKRLNGLVQSILDLARLERDGNVLKREEVSLVELVDSMTATFVPTAFKSGVDLVFKSPQELMVKVDAQLISQAVSNLISNALRHSGSKSICVSVESAGKTVRIIVEDHGIGIPPEQAARVFERFHRVDPARAAETGGAGLGLAIVRRIAQMHGGDVSLSAATPHGCRFELSIPT